MSYMLANADGTLAEGAYDTAPTPAIGQRVVLVPSYYPARARWSAESGGGFVDLDPPVVAPMAVVDFMLLFTPAEFLGIKAQRSANPQVDYFWSLLEASTNGVRLGHPALVQGVHYLVTAGMLSADRAATILAGNSPA